MSEYNSAHNVGRSDVAPLGARAFNYAPWAGLPPTSPASAMAQRPSLEVSILERLMALGLLVVLLPLVLLVGLAVLVDSPNGPVFYRQERVGLNRRRGQDRRPEGGDVMERRRRQNAGRPFLIYKFRTMVPGAEAKTGPVWATDRDPRVTRIGGILRQLRLDEVPQLINIALGQMSLIGPRPERPHFVDQFCREIPDYTQRLSVPPGITGLAQVERHYDAGLDDVKKKLKYDLFYVGNRCLLMDLKILIKTVDVMLRGKGAR